MYNNTTWKFLDPKFLPGQYLGPAIDVGSAITSKIPNNTGEFVLQSNLRTLTMEDMENLYFTK